MAYKYLVFRLYMLASGLDYDDTPKYTAIMSVSALFLLNIAAVNNLAGYYGFSLPIFTTPISAITTSAALLILNIMVVNRIGIEHMQSQILKKIDTPKDILVFIYIVGTIVFYIVSI